MSDENILDLREQLEEWANCGLCPAVVNDDDGRWAISFDGASPVTCGEKFGDDVALTTFVSPDAWKDNLLDALAHAREELADDD